MILVNYVFLHCGRFHIIEYICTFVLYLNFMEPVKKIFSIRIKTEYSNSDNFINFSINPTKETSLLFKQYSLSLISNGSGYDLIWLIKGINDIETCFNNKIRDKIFRFQISLNDTNIFNFIKIVPNKFYSFYNNRGNNSLLCDDLQLEEDTNVKIFNSLPRINVSQLTSTKNTFGIINIDMSLQEKCDNFEYFINLKSISSYWFYHINFRSKKKSEIKYFEINNFKYNFTNMGAQNDGWTLYSSEDPIILRENGYYDVSACLHDNTRIALPAPFSYDRISSDGRYISDVFYYV